MLLTFATIYVLGYFTLYVWFGCERADNYLVSGPDLADWRSIPTHENLFWRLPHAEGVANFTDEVYGKANYFYGRLTSHRLDPKTMSDYNERLKGKLKAEPAHYFVHRQWGILFFYDLGAFGPYGRYFLQVPLLAPKP